MFVTTPQRRSRLGALCLDMPLVLLEALGYQVLEAQLPGNPGTKEVGQEVPTTVLGPN